MEHQHASGRHRSKLGVDDVRIKIWRAEVARRERRRVRSLQVAERGERSRENRM